MENRFVFQLSIRKHRTRSSKVKPYYQCTTYVFQFHFENVRTNVSPMNHFLIDPNILEYSLFFPAVGTRITIVKLVPLYLLPRNQWFLLCKSLYSSFLSPSSFLSFTTLREVVVQCVGFLDQDTLIAFDFMENKDYSLEHRCWRFNTMEQNCKLIVNCMKI